MMTSSSANAPRGLTARDERQRDLERQYTEVITRPGFSGIALRELLILPQHSPSFLPHPDAALSNAKVEAFAREHGIWLEGLCEHSVTMTPYLHRSAIDEARLTIIGKCNIILFYLDDMFGTERQKSLLPQERQEASRTMNTLLSLLKTGRADDRSAPIVRATLEVLNDIRALTDPGWLEHLIDVTARHLELGTSNLDSGATMSVLDVDAYVKLRNHVSGMYPSIVMMEMASDNYLRAEHLDRVGVLTAVERLRYLCAALGAIVNDCFSFEKEVIQAKDDFNLIPVLMLNNPGDSLHDAIVRAAGIINEYTKEFFELSSQTRERVAGADLAARVNEHVGALTDAVEATWHWQISTGRYRRPNSIWRETRS